MGAGASTRNNASRAAKFQVSHRPKPAAGGGGEQFFSDAKTSYVSVRRLQNKGKEEELIMHKRSGMDRVSTVQKAFWRVKIDSTVYMVAFKHDIFSGGQWVYANGKLIMKKLIKFRLVGAVPFTLCGRSCKIDMNLRRLPRKEDPSQRMVWRYTLFMNGKHVKRFENLKHLHQWTFDAGGSEHNVQFDEDSMDIHMDWQLVSASSGFADVGSVYSWEVAGRPLTLEVKPFPTETGEMMMTVQLLLDGDAIPEMTYDTRDLSGLVKSVEEGTRQWESTPQGKKSRAATNQTQSQNQTTSPPADKSPPKRKGFFSWKKSSSPGNSSSSEPQSPTPETPEVDDDSPPPQKKKAGFLSRFGRGRKAQGKSESPQQ